MPRLECTPLFLLVHDQKPQYDENTGLDVLPDNSRPVIQILIPVDSPLRAMKISEIYQQYLVEHPDEEAYASPVFLIGWEMNERAAQAKLRARQNRRKRSTDLPRRLPTHIALKKTRSGKK